ncbi:hypothetical protein HF394_17520 [Planococcus glaciei]|uniref:Uncharacterized protein n=1 Tax=Planococcus glaciei TaxID=459472 RepID=A0A7H8QDZ2_9BACL|nr:hypothetical protein [Planococcus glaciei]QKX52228.1 hypothetical protein HF394_17520 [Planococcus glaciei]
MFKTISWHIIIDAKTKEKANKLINKLMLHIGEMNIQSLDSYWKDNTQYELFGSTPLVLERPEEAVFEVLQLAARLGNENHVIGPVMNECQVAFEVVCSASTVSGISWLHMEINNFN